MAQQYNKKKKREILNENPFEAVNNLASDITDSVSNDVFAGVAKSAISQVFGTSKPKHDSPDLKGEINFNQKNEDDLRRQEIQSYQKQRESIEKNVFSYKESVELQKTIEQLLKEIKKLVASTSGFTSEVKAMTMEEIPVNPGKYHVNFFEWLLSMVKSLREKVEDSRTWMAVFHSKKKQRQYWSMFKKHGTSFGLSSERSLATQAG